MQKEIDEIYKNTSNKANNEKFYKRKYNITVYGEKKISQEYFKMMKCLGIKESCKYGSYKTKFWFGKNNSSINVHLNFLHPQTLTVSNIYNDIKNSDFSVCFLDKQSFPNYTIFNEAALKANVALLFSIFEDSVAYIGPVVIRGKTACYACLRYRIIACSNDVAHSLLLEAARLNPQSAKQEINTKSIIDEKIARNIATIAVYLSVENLSMQPNIEVMSQIYEIDFLMKKKQTHFINKRDDCPICSRYKSRKVQNMTGGHTFNESSPIISELCGIIRRVEFANNVEFNRLKSPPVISRSYLSDFGFSCKNKEQLLCYGKGWTKKQAIESAIGESIERYSSYCWDSKKLIRGTADSLDTESIDPISLVLYDDEQYKDLPYDKYDRKNILTWVYGNSAITNKKIAIPALAVYCGYPGYNNDRKLFEPNTSGLACGKSFEFAFLSALLELLERDAFLITWFHGLETVRLNPFTHPNQNFRDLVSYYKEKMIEVFLCEIPSDHPCVIVAAFSLATKRWPLIPAVSFGLGAALTKSEAANKALLEMVQVQSELTKQLTIPSVINLVNEIANRECAVSNAWHHGLYYCHPNSAVNVKFLIDAPLKNTSWEDYSYGQSEAIQILLRYFKKTGIDVIYVDITPKSLSNLSLKTIRVVIPEIQPIHFGFNKRRLGGERIFNVPFIGRLQHISREINELRSEPHPLC